ncbi:MAG: ATP-dependent Clp protease adaptor ClpS [Spirochaetaceae bacterium]|jgi:ATP-dependent Clp protease adaptor protein ClpS|nr:ATP-dependent Clp protease adaptor ClpS [Spirochaetaceae bacterium]MBO4705619.1 ATP-dependent Clp protease adaptor ClpS [Spirochaetaceae bacterium]
MNWKIEEFADSALVTEEEITAPDSYNVILYNDDYTTKEFVVSLLMGIFNKPETEAVSLMETVHRRGSAVIGVYSFDIAQTLAAAAIQNARNNGFPLRCELEVA